MLGLFLIGGEIAPLDEIQLLKLKETRISYLTESRKLELTIPQTYRLTRCFE